LLKLEHGSAGYDSMTAGDLGDYGTKDQAAHPTRLAGRSEFGDWSRDSQTHDGPAGQKTTSQGMYMRLFFLVYQLFTRDQKVKLGALVALTVVNGFLDVFSIGMLFPYVALIENPERISKMQYLGAVYRWFNLGSEQSFLIVMSIGLLFLFCARGFFALWLTNFQLRFVNDARTRFGRRLLRLYMEGPYELFLATNTTTLIANLTSSLNEMCGGAMASALALIAETIAFLGLIAVLIYLNPVFSLLALVLVGGVGVAFSILVRKRIAYYGREHDARWKAMLRTVNETLSASKEIRVLRRIPFFVEAYIRESHNFDWAQRRYAILSQLPRVALEAFAVGALVGFCVIAIATGRLEGQLFPILAVFAAATVRIVPSLSRIIHALNSINFYRPSIAVVLSALKGEIKSAASNDDKPLPALSLERDIRIVVRSFSFPGNPYFQLKDIDLCVKRGEKVAIVGPSGSGKSTFMDVLLGLFPKFDGEIIVDGVDRRGDVKAWQRNVGYIPQSVYLLDDSITRNVAFGIERRNIDLQAVARAVSLAGLERVVETQASGLDTEIGDRGIRLSGGERQRIGIARALYHDPAVLILDEATSALDNQTERQIIDSILALSPAKTVIIIAHRLSSVTLCDRVYLMTGGCIVDMGSFEEVAKRHPDFVNPQSALNEEAHAKATSLLNAEQPPR
jgi:ATP-binding cassette subfamily C protein